MSTFQAPTTAWGSANPTPHRGPTVEDLAERQRRERRERFDTHISKTLESLTSRFPKMAHWSLDTYPDDAAGRTARAALEPWLGEYSDLYIHGPVGVGTTGLAWSAMRWCLEIEGAAVDFANVRQILTATRRSFSNGTHDPLEALAAVQLLVLDDLGAERATDWALDAIATLVEERYQSDRTTIVTSNYAPSGLVKRLGHSDPIIGERIVSRLVEGSTKIGLDGTDRRLTS